VDFVYISRRLLASKDGLLSTELNELNEHYALRLPYPMKSFENAN